MTFSRTLSKQALLIAVAGLFYGDLACANANTQPGSAPVEAQSDAASQTMSRSQKRRAQRARAAQRKVEEARQQGMAEGQSRTAAVATSVSEPISGTPVATPSSTGAAQQPGAEPSRVASSTAAPAPLRHLARIPQAPLPRPVQGTVSAAAASTASAVPAPAASREPATPRVVAQNPEEAAIQNCRWQIGEKDKEVERLTAELATIRQELTTLQSHHGELQARHNNIEQTNADGEAAQQFITNLIDAFTDLLGRVVKKDTLQTLNYQDLKHQHATFAKALEEVTEIIKGAGSVAPSNDKQAAYEKRIAKRLGQYAVPVLTILVDKTK